MGLKILFFKKILNFTLDLLQVTPFPTTKKSFTDAVENTFLRKGDTYLKLPLQNIFLEMFC